MTLHYSRLGLIENGFKEVAAYECFAKGRRKLSIQCWTDGRIFLVRDFFSKGRAWDMVYDNKNDANERVVYLWSKYSFHKRVR
jgi:hypothetical protein